MHTFCFQFQYRPVRQHRNADTLSRNPNRKCWIKPWQYCYPFNIKWASIREKIRLCGCAGWSAPLLFANKEDMFLTLKHICQWPCKILVPISRMLLISSGKLLIGMTFWSWQEVPKGISPPSPKTVIRTSRNMS